MRVLVPSSYKHDYVVLSVGTSHQVRKKNLGGKENCLRQWVESLTEQVWLEEERRIGGLEGRDGGHRQGED